MPDLVFPSTAWGPLDPSHIRRDFNAVLRPDHEGENPAYEQHQLGHHDISMTVGTYGHLIAGENRQAVNRPDDPNWKQKKASHEESEARTGNRLATGNEKGVRLACLTP